MHSMNSSHRASGDLPSPMSLRENHIYDINGLSDKDKFKLLSAKALDYIDQHCAVSIRLDGIYIPPELRQMLDHKRPLHLNVVTQDAFSFETFKRCVTSFLSRERENDEHQNGHNNWNIIDHGFQTTMIIGYVFDGIKGFNVANYVFENLGYFVRCLRQQYRCMVTLSCEAPVVKLSSKLTVTIIHESPIIRHLAANFMQKSMIAAVTQCEMYHVNLILHQDLSSSIGTPPRLSHPPTLNDNRLIIPSLITNIPTKWDSFPLNDNNSLLTSDPLNFTDLLQSVGSNTFGSNSIQSTPSVGHPAIPRQYSTSITQNLTNALEQIRLDESQLNQRYLTTNLNQSLDGLSPTVTNGLDDFSSEVRQRRVPVDHASQLGAISDVTDEDEEKKISRIDQGPFFNQIRTLQQRFYSYGIRVGEEYSRITSILNIPPLISITETARERKIGTKKQWYFSLLLDGHLMLAYVWDSKKNDAKRRAYDTMVHLLNTTHDFLIKPVKNNKWKVVKASRQR